MKNLLFIAMILLVGCDSNRNQMEEINEDSIALHDPVVPDSMAYAPERKRDTSGTVAFKATGNEPFWTMEIDQKDSVWLNFVNDAAFTGVIPESIDMQAEEFSFTISQGSGKVFVTIIHEECINSMSGFKSPYTVKIDVKETSGQNKGEYRGCGKFL